MSVAAPAVARVAEIQQMLAALQTGTVAPAAPASATAPTSFQTQLAAAGGMAPATTAAAVAPAAGGGETQYDALIQAAAAKYGIDPALLKGLIRAESNFDPNAGSPAGAQGLTQLMPATAASLGVTNPYDPAQSIDGGAKYLAAQLRTFGGDVTKALAAYNAGPGAVQRYGGVPPYAETQAYVVRVQQYADGYRSSMGTAPVALAAAPAPALPAAPAVFASPTAGASII
ncbi:MAG TPA: lytic transglycosylase domain-containing protein [Capillimicrobium sp.]|nr:lytic transglycosylase domain-containing protein [Capillimicrobium sp.]